MYEIDLTDPAVILDPVTAYGQAREHSPVARLLIPGMAPTWVLTRHEGARAMLGDPRFEINASSFMRPDVPADCLPYMRTMSEMNGREHARLRRLVAPAFSARRADDFRPRIEPIVERLLDGLGDGEQDLLPVFTRPLPMEVICELVGIRQEDRAKWREFGATVAMGAGQSFADAIPAIMEGARAAVARNRREPADDLLSDLVRAADDGDRLSETELVTMIWQLVLSGQTPSNLIANAVVTLLSHPGQLALLRAEPARMPAAVEELVRWSGPTMLTIPRYAREDLELYGTRIAKGEAVCVSAIAANRDQRVFENPDAFDITRPQIPNLGFAHGPHFCLGASLARVQTEVALAGLLRRFPELALAAEPGEIRAPDPGTWRVTRLPVHFTA